MNNSPNGFFGFGIAPGILEVLEKLSFKIPTPIQEQSLPLAIEGKDLIGVAQTGTGKTLAFGIPMIQSALQGNGRGLIVLPTRELAIQVHEVLQKIGGPLGFKSVVLIGGEPIGRQVRDLNRDPHVVIGTPGRILDHLTQRTLNLSTVKILVLDEADRMLDMGFAPQISRILQVVPRDRQTMLFSATMPDAIAQIARSHMKLPVRVEIAPSGTTLEKVTQELFFVPKDAKPRLLEKILNEYRGSVLVFTRTKHGASKVAQGVRGFGHTSSEIHANRSLGQRKDAIEGFKTGRYRVLVATDIAARGIDVKGIELVVNYDLPQNAEDYVHRIGRTGRAGTAGHAIAFATPDQRGDVRGIERLTRIVLPLSRLPIDLPPARAYVPEPSRAPSPHGGSRPYRGGGAPSSRPHSRPSSGFRPHGRPRFSSSHGKRPERGIRQPAHRGRS